MEGGDKLRRAEAGGWCGDGVARSVEFEVSGEVMIGRRGAEVSAITQRQEFLDDVAYP